MEPQPVGRDGGQQPRVRGNASKSVGSAANALPAGTIVFTQDGELPVDFLSPGDRVITRDAGMVTLVAVRARKVRIRAVAIRAGSLGHTRPDKDCVLPAGQRVLLRDWRAQALLGARQGLVKAADLIDGEYVIDLGPRVLTLFALEFEAPHVLYADGMEVVSHIPVATAAEAA